MPRNAGGSLKEVPAKNKGLSKLPTEVRNKMGYLKEGKQVKQATTRGPADMGTRMYEAQQKEYERQRKEQEAYIESQLSDNRGGKRR